MTKDFIATVKEARRVWMEENPCEDGHDHVTPFDKFLMGTPSAAAIPNNIPAYETIDPILRPLLAKLRTLHEEMHKAATDLKADGVYRCCQGTYEHCAVRVADIVTEITK